MNTKSNETTAGTQSGRSEEVTPQAGLPGHSPREAEEAAVADEPAVADEAVARRTPTGWRVGGEEVPDLTSAMVLADLLAADLPSDDQWQAPGVATSAPVAAGQATEQGSGADVADPPAADAEQLKETVAQLERALTVR